MEHIEKQIAALAAQIESDAANADLYYRRGRLYWKLDRRGEAISDYERAVALDPQSPAAAALEMSRGIMDYFNPDMLNP